MAYLDVEWANQDVPTQTKGQQMDDNLDYVREVMRGRVVAQEAANVEFSVMGPDNWNLRLDVGPLSFTSSTVTSLSFVEVGGLKNLDVSSLVAGNAYKLTAVAVVGGDTQELGSTTFFATADLVFLSVFGQVREADPGSPFASMRGYAVILTRDNEGF